jgi:hypothetical protein
VRSTEVTPPWEPKAVASRLLWLPAMGTTRVLSGVLLALTLAGCEGFSMLNALPTRPPQTPADQTLLPDEPSCEGIAPTVPYSPLRRLSRAEYGFTLDDVLGSALPETSGFVPDEKVGGYASNAVSSITALQLEDYLAAAEEVATRTAARLSNGGLGCDLAQETCVLPYLRAVTRRLYRRPASPEALNRLADLYRSGRSQWGAQVGLSLALQAAASSPYFLYHLEPAALKEQVEALDAYSVASRLSYFLWQSAPDDTLLDAAEAGALSTPAQVEAQARRLLADVRADRTLRSFHEQWLELESLLDAPKDPARFPSYGDAMRASMFAETHAFAVDVFRTQGGSMAALLTGSTGFIDAPLAELYGISAPAGSGVVATALPAERAGVLTQGAFLASHAHAAETSWVLRGKFVREQLLCGQIPPPPPAVDMSTPNDPNRLTNPSCSGCHRLMDPIGLGFEAFDAIGRYRGGPASGEVQGGPADLNGSFEGVVALSARAAQSLTVHSCLTRQWFRYATGREETALDRCSLASAQGAMTRKGGDLRELLVALARSDALLYRLATP